MHCFEPMRKRVQYDELGTVHTCGTCRCAHVYRSLRRKLGSSGKRRNTVMNWIGMGLLCLRYASCVMSGSTGMHVALRQEAGSNFAHVVTCFGWVAGRQLCETSSVISVERLGCLVDLRPRLGPNKVSLRPISVSFHNRTASLQPWRATPLILGCGFDWSNNRLSGFKILIGGRRRATSKMVSNLFLETTNSA